jgi:hypothetical protein
LEHFPQGYFKDKSNAPTVTSGVNINKHTFKDLRDVRRSYPKNFMAAHLDINSLRYKFDEMLSIGKIQFAQYQLSDDVDKRWY